MRCCWTAASARCAERFDWRTAKQALAPPAFGTITVEAFLSRIRSALGRSIPVSPAVDEVFLSLVRIDGEGRVHPRLSRANHLKILHALWAQDTDGLLRRIGVPTLILATRSSAARPGAEGFVRAKRAAARSVRAVGGSVSFGWIEGIHDVPLQRPEAVARRIARFSETASRVRRRPS